MVFVIALLGVCAWGRVGRADAQEVESQIIKVYAAARPSVVMITTRHSRGVEGQPMDMSGRRGPLKASPLRGRVSATYSGIVYDTAGHILTVASAVENADEIEVTTWDGRRQKAEAVGADDRSGLGMIKVSDPTLKPLPMADSSELKVGSWIVVIGNPFGLRGTLSQGIVSGLGRKIEDHGGYLTNMIQITAPINPGDAGGAVLDLKGRLVGVVHAAFGRAPSLDILREMMGEGRQWIGGGMPESTMSAEGINFAMPISEARPLAEELAKTGTVTRGWTGMQVEDIAGEPGGGAKGSVQVRGVIPGAPAAQAGIQAGDQVLAVNGQPVKDVDQLVGIISRSAIGGSVQLNLLRAGQEVGIKVQVAQAPKTDEAYRSLLKEVSPFWKQGAHLGVLVQDLNPDLADDLKAAQGALVVSVLRGSAAERAGIRSQDVITALNGEAINTARELRRAVCNPKLGDSLALELYRDGAKKTIQIDMNQQ